MQRRGRTKEDLGDVRDLELLERHAVEHGAELVVRLQRIVELGEVLAHRLCVCMCRIDPRQPAALTNQLRRR